MKTIFCSVMDGHFVKEYELTYEEEEMKQFFEELKETEILKAQPVNNTNRVCVQVRNSEEYDKINILRSGEDIKNYIKQLHESSVLDLTSLNILMKSNGEMRNQQVREIFRKFFNLYNYYEKICYDAYYIPQITRKMYEYGASNEVPCYDSVNTEALNDIGFSIEGKINKQEDKFKQYKKVIK